VHPPNGRLGPIAIAWLLLALSFWSGCDGCRSPVQDSNQPKPNEPKNEFDFGGAQAFPLGSFVTQSGVKPGHWFTTSETIRANRADHRGLLRQSIEFQTTPSEIDAFDSGSGAKPASVERTAVPLISERPAVLPQMRTRRLDARLLAGLPKSINRDTQAWLGGQFISGTQAMILDTGQRPTTLLQPQEYFFVILTKRPERFSSLQDADWIRPPIADVDGNLISNLPRNYRLVIPKTDGLLTLPETLFDWTSTAVLLWDDLDPSALTAEQTRAVIDWVHFGGRLLVNGTGAGVELTRSQFAPWMPMEVQTSDELAAEAVAELLERWSVDGDSTYQQQAAVARQRSSRLAIDGKVHPSASPVRDSADLLLRRQVGSGLVILTKFDLTSDWMLGWRSRDSFFNAALLGRPPRRYITVDAVPQQQYVSQSIGRNASAEINTGLRFISRDGRLIRASADQASIKSDIAASKVSSVGGEFASHPISGLGGWRDDSDAALIATETLRSQSGITIPSRRFVIKSLAIYLAILVPLNYLFFRVLGRLEWAWLAVPVIGLAGAAWIAQGASLDVGFARSQTEIAIVEMQPEYRRGHATRFVSLYNSLSRRYDFAFDNPDAVIAPIGVLGQVKVGEDERQPVTIGFGFANGPVLRGVSVASNRTRIFHAEQIIDMGGSVVQRDDSLRNNTDFDFLDCRLIRRDANGDLSVASLGNINAGGRAALRWQATAAIELSEDLPLGLHRLMNAMLRSETLPPGASRLVARTEKTLPGMRVVPETSQQSFGAVIVAHLSRPMPATPRGDANLIPDPLERERQLRRQGVDTQLDADPDLGDQADDALDADVDAAKRVAPF
jgi:hypothetical protein